MSNRKDQRFIMPHRSTGMFSRMLKMATRLSVYLLCSVYLVCFVYLVEPH